MRFLGSLVVLGLWLLPMPAAADHPHASFRQLTTGNGFGFAVFNGDTRRLELFTDHPYRAVDARTETRNLAHDAYFGVRAGGGSRWLGDVPVDHLEYLDDSGIVHATQQVGALRAETFLFAPFAVEAPAAVLALRVTNVSGVVQRNAAVYALLNFHLGAGVERRGPGDAPVPDARGERARRDPATGTYTETGPSGLSLRYLPLAPTTHHGVSPDNPYAVGLLGGELTDLDDSGPRDDVVPGYQWSLPELAPGASRWVGVLVTLADDARARAYTAGRGAEALVTAERAQWTAWRTPPPRGLDPLELPVYRQAEAVLRMGQVREPGRGRGAIVASLPPGIWWISWVRDMAYATVALARAGHRDEAARAVDFWAGASVGRYREYVGRDYHVSVVRYFGNGEEETDFNEHGPNIEFDGFGLSLWAARAAGRRDLDRNAETLRGLVTPNGLIAADSSIWEVHWNGQQKQFGYTSITAARGLCDAGDAPAARALRDAIVRELVLPSGGLAQSLEELRGMRGARDAAVIEAINFGLLDPRGALARGTLAELTHLRSPGGRGYFRNDDGGGYDNQEWVFIDLRVAAALRRVGRTDEADELLAWVTQQASHNFNLQAELYHRENADYVGAIPMVGFGAGAYLLALQERAEPPAAMDPCFPPETRTTMSPLEFRAPPAEPAGGPRCDAHPGRPARPEGLPWALALALAPWLLRRRGTSPVGRALALTLGLAACEDQTQRLLPDSSPVFEDVTDAVWDASSDVSMDTSTDISSDTVAAPQDGGPLADGGSLRGPLPVRSCGTSFVYNLGRQATRVSVAGEWNRFSTTADPMSDGLFSNTYRAELRLPPGDYGYKFFADGTWALDPSHGLTRYVGDVENSRVEVPDCRDPELRVLRAEATPDGAVTLEFQYLDGTERRGLDPAGAVVTVSPGALPAGAVTTDRVTGRVTVRVTGLSRTKYTFRVNARSASGRAAREVLLPMWVEEEPYGWGDGPMYFVFTDRFRNGDSANDGRVGGTDPRADYYGGDYAGVLTALREGYFDRLGVRVLWLSPANRNTHSLGRGSDGRMYTGYHGYWPVAPREVEPHFGTLATLRELTAEAHRRGIRVLLDLVQNQLHRDHPYYRDHARDGWFNGDGSCVCGGPGCGWDEHALDCWFTDYLPDVRWTTMAAVDQMISDALWWLVEADLDGFRVDAVKHMQHIASTTLRARIAELERGNTRYYTVGETFTGADGRDLVRAYISPRELHAQFDFPLFWSILEAFARGRGTLGDLEAAVAASERAYGDAVMSPFLGNHDVERFLSHAAGQLVGDTREQGYRAPPGAPTDPAAYERVALAFTFLLTQRGIPLIYYGDEVGMPGAADPDNRRPMRFGTDLSAQETRLLEHVRAVGRLRATHPGLRRGARRSLHTDGDGYVYTRGAGADVAVVALNRGTTARMVSVRLPRELGVPDGTVLRDALGGPSVTASGGSLGIALRPRGSSIYVR